MAIRLNKRKGSERGMVATRSEPDNPTKSRQYRAIFLSDIHLGTRGCQAEYLLDFLKYNDAEIIYLAGDIIDGWRLKRSWYWPQSHNDVVQKLLRKARKGAKLVYVPGNHDEALRQYIGVHFGGVVVAQDMIHTTADGKRLLVMHGDAFDGVVRYARWLALLGDSAYTLALTINTWFNFARRKLGLGYWSLSAYLKNKVKNAVKFVDSFERAVAQEAQRRGVDGVVCGHIHKAEMRTIGDILYINDGDWVESCTALVEHHDGRLEIIAWAEQRNFSMLERRVDPSTPDDDTELAA
ncbi:UDP-2,3-diacylglucosamine pyrophosphatase LpxH [Limibacillus sp. MBR-115]